MALFEKVRTIISALTGLEKDEITRDKTLSELKMDPLDIEELQLALEEEFDVLFTDQANIKDVDGLVQYIMADA